MAEDADELRRLEQAVRATVKERMDLEQRFANPSALRSATARAFRDRDAVTSPALEEARGKVAEDIADFHEEWRHVDKIARNVERLDGLLEEAPAPIRKHRDAVAAELPEVRQVRARIAEDLKRFGLESILPEDGIGDGQG